MAKSEPARFVRQLKGGKSMWKGLVNHVDQIRRIQDMANNLIWRVSIQMNQNAGMYQIHRRQFGNCYLGSAQRCD